MPIEQKDPNNGAIIFVPTEEEKQKLDKQKKVIEQSGIIADLGINVRQPPYNAKGDGTTDDYAVIKLAMDEAISTNRTLYFPTPPVSYCISQKLVINTKVKWVGQESPTYNGTDKLEKGVVIEGQGIYISGGNSHYFENIGVQNPNNANGFQILGSVTNTIFNNCMSLARDHCYLMESYEGTVDSIKLINCKAYKATHGFITKSKNTIFERCEAYNILGGYGFGFVSDNIIGASKKGISTDCKAIACSAYNCDVGFASYSRDMFSSNNTNGISQSGLTLIGCSVTDCPNGYLLGDTGTPSTGVSYNPIYNVNLISCSERKGSKGVNSLLIGRVYGLNVIGGTIENPYAIPSYSNASNLYFSELNSLLSKNGTYSDIETFSVNVGTPSVLTGRTIFKTANTATTSITNILSGKENRLITLLISDDFTTINNGGNFSLKRASFSKKGSWVVMKLQDGIWTEIYGHQSPQGTYTQNLSTNSSLDLSQGCVFDLIGTGTTTNKVSIPSNTRHLTSETITIIIRSTTGSFTFGGFDTNSFVVPSDVISTSVSFGTALITRWVYMGAISKWVNVSRVTSPYV